MQATRLETRKLERVVPHHACVREPSHQDIVSNVGHNDGLRTEYVEDETTRSLFVPVFLGWKICSIFACNNQM